MQELSAVPGEEIGGYCPRTAVNRAGAGARDPRHHALPGEFPPASQAARLRRTKRREVSAKGGNLDWAFAEALAFGTLVLEGTPVRLSGQDSGRGTFSQRHLAFYDSETGKRYVPLQHISPDQARFEVFDSSLSEYAVLGFEFGYSVADPLTLVIWEAQFGDFANGAQIMIDQFISCCEQKWGQPSGLVMLLPHGYRRAGSGAFQRAHRALPHALRGEQHAGVQLHHAGAILPPAAPPDVRRAATAAACASR